ncbi:MAG: phosphotransferase [Clostridia bacterium]|nr:phosphotransferase [Clostridia bacterium]
MTIQEICSLFDIGGQYIDCSELGIGNINSTYIIDFIRDGEQKQFCLQRINKNAFKNPEQVMDNIVKVTNYVREKTIQKGLPSKRFVLRAFNALDGKPFVVDDNGDYWRCYRYIRNSVTYDSTNDLNIIENVGKAFGRFQNCLDGFSASELYITIPNFHNTIKRFEDFHKAIEEDPFDRAKKVKVEIEKLLSFEERATKLQRLCDSGDLPIRVTHNDTKCNNVSFDKDTNEALAVLDLDTVMPGLIAHDYGDAIRFIANAVVEDCPDISKVKIDFNKYEAFTKGFLGEVNKSLTELEKQTLNLGVFTITVELATRFLADYLNGDKYFKVKYPGHNVFRTKNQIALAEDFIKQEEKLNEILKKYL